MKLRECVAADDDARLLIIFETQDIRGVELLRRELRDMGALSWQGQAGTWRLALLAPGPGGGRLDAWLNRVQEKVDQVNARREFASVELVETRLVASAPVPRADTRDATVIGSFTLVAQGGTAGLPREILFDGGRTFGSGSHPSTRLAASLLEQAAEELPAAQVLDVGCGSGVLSLICARLGARRTVGVDICPDSLAVARRNVARNSLSGSITISDTPVRDLAGPFDLIAANLTLAVLYCLLADLGRLCRAGGLLVVSGLQGRQADDVLPRLLADDWRLEKRVHEGKWQAMLLRRLVRPGLT